MPHFSLANACQELGDVAVAQQHFARAAELRPDKRLWRLRAEICGPAVFQSTPEISEYCKKVERALKCIHLAPRDGHNEHLAERDEYVGAERNAPSPPATLPTREGRIVFVPRQSFADYCRLLQACDVLLDSLHYGAGSSCYNIFSYNLPLVTLPTELMPGRVALAFYRKMGCEELVASSSEDYIGKAVRVATDRDYCRQVTDQIAARSDVLFNDLEAVREHERFFEEALARVE